MPSLRNNCSVHTKMGLLTKRCYLTLQERHKRSFLKITKQLMTLNSYKVAYFLIW